MNDSLRTDKRPALLNAVVACCLFAVLLVCYYQGFYGPFMLDDISSVLPAKIDALSIAEFVRVADGDESGLFGRSIPVASFALNNYLGDGSPFSFKVSNFLLHAIITMVVYPTLIRIFTVLNQYQRTFTASDINKLALFCAAVWALHPLQISTVLYVVQRMAMLSSFFSIAALWLFLILRTSVLSQSKRTTVMVLMGGSILAACLSKENGVLAFAFIGFVELLILRFRKPDGQLLPLYRRAFVAVTTFVFLALVYVLSTRHTQLLSGYVVRDFDVWERLMTEPGVLLMYLNQIVFPNIADMSLYHDAYPVVRQMGLPVFIPAGILLLLITVSLVLFRKLPILLFGVGFFLISHSIESTFLPLELVFEHRNYLALIGVLAPIAWLLMLAVKSLKVRVPMKLMVTAALALLSAQTYTRSIEWSDEELFYQQALAEQPTSIRALNDWTAYLSAQGLNAETITHLEYSYRIRPDSPHFLIQLLMYSGAVDGPNEKLLIQVKEQIASNPLKIEEVSALQDMYHHYYKKRFDWPDANVITELYAKAATNPEKYLKTPAESLLFRQYSSLLFASGQRNDALAAAIHAVELDRVAPEPLLQLAQQQLDLKQEEAASRTLRQLATVDRYDRLIAERNAMTDILLQLSIAEIE